MWHVLHVKLTVLQSITEAVAAAAAAAAAAATATPSSIVGVTMITAFGKQSTVTWHLLLMR